MNEQRRFPWWIILVGVGCLVIICIGVLIVGGGATYFLIFRSDTASMPEPITPVAVEVLEPTSIPTATFEPTPLEPTDSPPPTLQPTRSEPTSAELALTGEQYVDEYSLMDDFSSDALGWPVYDDGMTILEYEDQAYSFQIREPDYYDWAYFPVDFIPYEIWFDVQAVSESQDGTFGVFCQFQDSDNYYYVEFDLAESNYIIGQIYDGEYIPLEGQTTSGQNWVNTNTLNSSPSSVNRIGISCYLESITLFINDEWVDEVNLSQPFDQPGEAAFFVYAFETVDENGYEVFFDNVEVYQPVQ